MRLFIFLSCFLLALPGIAFGETHEAVQAALDYQLPENTCSKPDIITADVSSSPPVPAAGSAALFVGSSNSDVSDVDTYTRKRQERKEKRWISCVASYKDSLLVDIEGLKSSAQHGISQAQAQIILANMAKIQQVYMTSDGVIEQHDVAENSKKSED